MRRLRQQRARLPHLLRARVEHLPAQRLLAVRVRAAQVWALVRDAVTAWIEDGATRMGAALAYYTLFSIAPLLLISISLAGLLFGAEAARGEVIGQLSSLVGEQSARTIESMLVEVGRLLIRFIADPKQMLGTLFEPS